MKLLFFLLASRIKYHPAPNYIFYLFLIPSLIFGAFFWAFLFRTLNLNVELQCFGIFNFILIISFLSLFFPNYYPKKNLFPSIYPINFFKLYIISLAYDFLSFFNAFLALFVITLSLVQSTFYYLPIVYFILITIGFYFKRIIHSFIESNVNGIHKLIALTIYLLLLFFASYSIYFEKHIYIVLSSILFCSFIFDFYLELSIYNNHSSLKNNKVFLKKKYSFISYLFNQHSFKINLIVVLIYKLVILFADYFIVLKKGEHLFNLKIVFWFFLSPLIIFTFLFNNLWGFARNIWLVTFLASNYRKQIFDYLHTISFFLFFDILISCIFVYLTKEDYFKFIPFYFFSSIVLILNGILFSYFNPIFLTNKFSFRTNSSLLSNLSSALIVFVMYNWVSNFIVQFSFMLIYASLFIFLWKKTSPDTICYRQLFKSN